MAEEKEDKKKEEDKKKDEKKKKGKGFVGWIESHEILSVVLIAGAAIVGYLFLNRSSSSSTSTTPSSGAIMPSSGVSGTSSGQPVSRRGIGNNLQQLKSSISSLTQAIKNMPASSGTLTSGTTTSGTTTTSTNPITTAIQKLTTTQPVQGATGKLPTGNQPFAPLNSLEVVAKRFGIPMQVNTHGQTAVFYAGMQNGIPQVAKYSNTGNFLGTYAQENLLNSVPPIGSIANGKYIAPGHYKIGGA